MIIRLFLNPIINRSYSWINSITNMGIGIVPHIIFSVIVLIISIIIFNFVKARYFDNKIINYLFSFWSAGGFCSLIDRVFWGGSLDYIKLKGVFIFDLKDVYLTIGESIVLISIIFNYKKLKNVDEKIIYNDFKLYIRLKGIKK